MTLNMEKKHNINIIIVNYSHPRNRSPPLQYLKFGEQSALVLKARQEKYFRCLLSNGKYNVMNTKNTIYP